MAPAGVTLAGRFVTPGTPTIDLGGPAPLPTGRRARARRAAGPRAVVRESSGLSTLESTSPVLRARLAALAAKPSAEHYMDVAAAYQTHGVDDRAFDYLSEALTRYPRHHALHEAVARMWRNWGLPDHALRHAHLAARYGPASAQARNTLGTVLWALGQPEAAARAFSEALALDGKAAYALYNLCIVTEALHQPPPAACLARPASEAPHMPSPP